MDEEREGGFLYPNSCLVLTDTKQPNLLGTLYHAKMRRGAQEHQVLVHRLSIRDEKLQAMIMEEMQSCLELQKDGNFSPYILKYIGLTQEGGDVVNIITEKYNYSLAALLRPKNGSIMPPLLTRITWARDIARGMQYLSRIRPHELHMHLNTSQIKVEDSNGDMRIKLVNWSFQKCQHRKISRSQSSRTVADLYWKSPEELCQLIQENTESTSADEPKKQPDKEKCDVYSYSIILWELLNPGKVPFVNEYKDFGPFVDAVSQNKRPTMLGHTSSNESSSSPKSSSKKEKEIDKKDKKELSSELLSFMDILWHSDPQQRPSWDRISSFMTEYALNLSIKDERGREFWVKSFNERDVVPWIEFYPKFYHFLGLHVPSNTDVLDVKAKCLLAVLYELSDINEEDSTEAGAEKLSQLIQNFQTCTVSSSQFAKMLDWFGPLETSSNRGLSTRGSPLLDSIHELLRKAWFHGALPGKQSEDLVTAGENGAFLVRFSTSSPGCYAITVKTKGVAKHYRIMHKAGLNYLIGKVECSSLDEVIFKFRDDLNLLHPCKESKFVRLFEVERNFSGTQYNTWNDD
eukprot:TRINITY_DN10636_c0_g1_i1.p1 TRINITY_DN10636_c0_g1~~TRINITY_DN10636_c0_g1_i1.p1  ORF type:complete len:574 (-),score=79.89 TRINITY_DN10636_c0_g1_i1:12-1733(-)